MDVQIKVLTSSQHLCSTSFACRSCVEMPALGDNPCHGCVLSQTAVIFGWSFLLSFSPSLFPFFLPPRPNFQRRKKQINKEKILLQCFTLNRDFKITRFGRRLLATSTSTHTTQSPPRVAIVI